MPTLPNNVGLLTQQCRALDRWLGQFSGNSRDKGWCLGWPCWSQRHCSHTLTCSQCQRRNLFCLPPGTRLPSCLYCDRLGHKQYRDGPCAQFETRPRARFSSFALVGFRGANRAGRPPARQLVVFAPRRFYTIPLPLSSPSYPLKCRSRSTSTTTRSSTSTTRRSSGSASLPSRPAAAFRPPQATDQLVGL